MPRKFRELLDRLSPERQKKIAKRVKKTVKDMKKAKTNGKNQ